MISMALKKRKGPENAVGVDADGRKWPYGLVIRLESEQIERLPALANVSAGDEVTFACKGYIESHSKTQTRSRDADSETVVIQITHLDFRETEREMEEKAFSEDDEAPKAQKKS